MTIPTSYDEFTTYFGTLVPGTTTAQEWALASYEMVAWLTSASTDDLDVSAILTLIEDTFSTTAYAIFNVDNTTDAAAAMLVLMGSSTLNTDLAKILSTAIITQYTNMYSGTEVPYGQQDLSDFSGLLQTASMSTVDNSRLGTPDVIDLSWTYVQSFAADILVMFGGVFDTSTDIYTTLSNLYGITKFLSDIGTESDRWSQIDLANLWVTTLNDLLDDSTVTDAQIQTIAREFMAYMRAYKIKNYSDAMTDTFQEVIYDSYFQDVIDIVTTIEESRSDTGGTSLLGPAIYVSDQIDYYKSLMVASGSDMTGQTFVTIMVAVYNDLSNSLVTYSDEEKKVYLEPFETSVNDNLADFTVEVNTGSFVNSVVFPEITNDDLNLNLGLYTIPVPELTCTNLESYILTAISSVSVTIDNLTQADFFDAFCGETDLDTPLSMTDMLTMATNMTKSIAGTDFASSADTIQGAVLEKIYLFYLQYLNIYMSSSSTYSVVSSWMADTLPGLLASSGIDDITSDLAADFLSALYSYTTLTDDTEITGYNFLYTSMQYIAFLYSAVADPSGVDLVGISEGVLTFLVSFVTDLSDLATINSNYSSLTDYVNSLNDNGNALSITPSDSDDDDDSVDQTVAIILGVIGAVLLAIALIALLDLLWGALFGTVAGVAAVTMTAMIIFLIILGIIGLLFIISAIICAYEDCDSANLWKTPSDNPTISFDDDGNIEGIISVTIGIGVSGSEAADLVPTTFYFGSLVDGNYISAGSVANLWTINSADTIEALLVEMGEDLENFESAIGVNFVATEDDTTLGDMKTEINGVYTTLLDSLSSTDASMLALTNIVSAIDSMSDDDYANAMIYFNTAVTYASYISTFSAGVEYVNTYLAKLFVEMFKTVTNLSDFSTTYESDFTFMMNSYLFYLDQYSLEVSDTTTSMTDLSATIYDTYVDDFEEDSDVTLILQYLYKAAENAGLALYSAAMYRLEQAIDLADSTTDLMTDDVKSYMFQVYLGMVSLITTSLKYSTYTSSLSSLTSSFNALLETLLASTDDDTDIDYATEVGVYLQTQNGQIWSTGGQYLLSLVDLDDLYSKSLTLYESMSDDTYSTASIIEMMMLTTALEQCSLAVSAGSSDASYADYWERGLYALTSAVELIKPLAIAASAVTAGVITDDDDVTIDGVVFPMIVVETLSSAMYLIGNAAVDTDYVDEFYPIMKDYMESIETVSVDTDTFTGDDVSIITTAELKTSIDSLYAAYSEDTSVIYDIHRAFDYFYSIYDCFALADALETAATAAGTTVDTTLQTTYYTRASVFYRLALSQIGGVQAYTTGLVDAMTLAQGIFTMFVYSLTDLDDDLVSYLSEYYLYYQTGMVSLFYEDYAGIPTLVDSSDDLADAIYQKTATNEKVSNELTSLANFADDISTGYITGAAEKLNLALSYLVSLETDDDEYETAFDYFIEAYFLLLDSTSDVTYILSSIASFDEFLVMGITSLDLSTDTIADQTYMSTDVLSNAFQTTLSSALYFFEENSYSADYGLMVEVYTQQELAALSLANADYTNANFYLSEAMALVNENTTFSDYLFQGMEDIGEIITVFKTLQITAGSDLTTVEALESSFSTYKVTWLALPDPATDAVAVTNTSAIDTYYITSTPTTSDVDTLITTAQDSCSSYGCTALDDLSDVVTSLNSGDYTSAMTSFQMAIVNLRFISYGSPSFMNVMMAMQGTYTLLVYFLQSESDYSSYVTGFNTVFEEYMSALLDQINVAGCDGSDIADISVSTAATILTTLQTNYDAIKDQDLTPYAFHRIYDYLFSTQTVLASAQSATSDDDKSLYYGRMADNLMIAMSGVSTVTDNSLGLSEILTTIQTMYTAYMINSLQIYTVDAGLDFLLRDMYRVSRFNIAQVCGGDLRSMYEYEVISSDDLQTNLTDLDTSSGSDAYIALMGYISTCADNLVDADRCSATSNVVLAMGQVASLTDETEINTGMGYINVVCVLINQSYDDVSVYDDITLTAAYSSMLTDRLTYVVAPISQDVVEVQVTSETLVENTKLISNIYNEDFPESDYSIDVGTMSLVAVNAFLANLALKALQYGASMILTTKTIGLAGSFSSSSSEERQAREMIGQIVDYTKAQTSSLSDTDVSTLDTLTNTYETYRTTSLGLAEADTSVATTTNNALDTFATLDYEQSDVSSLTSYVASITLTDDDHSAATLTNVSAMVTALSTASASDSIASLNSILTDDMPLVAYGSDNFLDLMIAIDFAYEWLGLDLATSTDATVISSFNTLSANFLNALVNYDDCINTTFATLSEFVDSITDSVETQIAAADTTDESDAAETLYTYITTQAPSVDDSLDLFSDTLADDSITLFDEVTTAYTALLDTGTMTDSTTMTLYYLLLSVSAYLEFNNFDAASYYGMAIYEALGIDGVTDSAGLATVNTLLPDIYDAYVLNFEDDSSELYIVEENYYYYENMDDYLALLEVDTTQVTVADPTTLSSAVADGSTNSVLYTQLVDADSSIYLMYRVVDYLEMTTELLIDLASETDSYTQWEYISRISNYFGLALTQASSTTGNVTGLVECFDVMQSIYNIIINDLSTIGSVDTITVSFIRNMFVNFQFQMTQLLDIYSPALENLEGETIDDLSFYLYSLPSDSPSTEYNTVLVWLENFVADMRLEDYESSAADLSSACSAMLDVTVTEEVSSLWIYIPVAYYLYSAVASEGGYTNDLLLIESFQAMLKAEVGNLTINTTLPGYTCSDDDDEDYCAQIDNELNMTLDLLNESVIYMLDLYAGTYVTDAFVGDFGLMVQVYTNLEFILMELEKDTVSTDTVIESFEEVISLAQDFETLSSEAMNALETLGQLLAYFNAYVGSSTSTLLADYYVYRNATLELADPDEDAEDTTYSSLMDSWVADISYDYDTLVSTIEGLESSDSTSTLTGLVTALAEFAAADDLSSAFVSIEDVYSSAVGATTVGTDEYLVVAKALYYTFNYLESTVSALDSASDYDDSIYYLYIYFYQYMVGPYAVDESEDDTVADTDTDTDTNTGSDKTEL